jgi:hypothetical protein
MLEAQAQYIAQCVNLLHHRGLRAMEVRAQTQQAYNAELHTRNKSTTYESGCHSWYIGPDGRNTNNWIGWMSEYGRRLRQVNTNDYLLEPAGAETEAPVPAAA